MIELLDSVKPGELESLAGNRGLSQTPDAEKVVRKRMFSRTL